MTRFRLTMIIIVASFIYRNGTALFSSVMADVTPILSNITSTITAFFGF